MAGKIIINTERCKGCGLCVTACPNKSIVTSEKSNKNGYYPAEAVGYACTGCALCAIVCPEAVIEVQHQSNIVTVGAGKKQKSSLTGEKV